jgi:hypothetical protein
MTCLKRGSPKCLGIFIKKYLISRMYIRSKLCVHFTRFAQITPSNHPIREHNCLKPLVPTLRVPPSATEDASVPTVDACLRILYQTMTRRHVITRPCRGCRAVLDIEFQLALRSWSLILKQEQIKNKRQQGKAESGEEGYPGTSTC